MASVNGLLARLEKLEQRNPDTGWPFLVINWPHETQDEALRRTLREKGLPEDYEPKRIMRVCFVNPEDMDA